MEAIVKNSFNIFEGAVDGVAEACTYKAENADPSYDATTGATTEPFLDIAIKAIRKKLTVKDSLSGGVYGIPGFKIKTDDRVYMIPRADLGRLPTENDKMVLSTGEIMSVVAFTSDPKVTGALITVVLRRP